jgi:uncharacterized membrane-anchored protein
MPMNTLDHPQRYALVNELHARPFPAFAAPATMAYLAVKEPVNAAFRDPSRDRSQLLALLDRHGAPHPEAGATHCSGQIGRAELKWESHTEFVSYLAVMPGLSERPFDPTATEVFPTDWLAQSSGKRMAAILIRVELMPEGGTEQILALAEDWFVRESLAMSRVIDGAAVVAGDFRLDAAGNMRFAVFVRPGTGNARIGRIAQRLCEMETYRALSMLGLIRVRALTERLNLLDPALSELVGGLDQGVTAADEALHRLLHIAAELESLASRYAFRFGATGAYEAIVTQRVAVLREERIAGRQTFGEFMMRRYDPAMRTVKAAEIRLASMADRAARAAELLRTRVDVERSAQNQRLLESMDRRADLALRLQHTVEGLSVVAISYYAVSLATYLLLPLAEAQHWPKSALTAGLVPLVTGGVWLVIRRIRRRMH